MTIRLSQILSIKGDGAENEDAFGSEGECAWVLDGATGVAASALGKGSDARWYVERFNALLEYTFKTMPEAPTYGVVRETLRAVKREYIAALNGLREPAHPPSAAFIMLRELSDRIELSALGDCAALYEEPDGRIGFFEGNSISQLETAALARLLEEQTNLPDAEHAEIFERVAPLLRANRSRMNTPDGYWILSIGEEAVDHLEVKKIETAPSAPILLMSDGFTRAFQSLDLTNPEALYQAVINNGADHVADQIRCRENHDPNCRRHPRFKKSDDATCIVVERV